MISHNLPDPTEQERIRRGPHTYMEMDGIHGRYIPTVNGQPVADPKRQQGVYAHQEYPKVMDKTPCPQLKDFGKKADDFTIVVLEEARKEWDTRQMASIVKNKTEEQAWITAHANDPVLTPGAYPKTMDRTQPPRASDCDGLEDYRQKRTAWREQIAASIVHDEVEEQLWLEEHPLPTRSKMEHVTVEPHKRGRQPKRDAENTQAVSA